MVPSILRRALLPVTLLLLAASIFAQAITKEQKAEVLAELEKIVTERMFVPGLDTKKWPDEVEKQRESIDKAENEREFVSAVNRALRNFGISHINLRTRQASERRRTGGTIGVGLVTTKTDEGLVVRTAYPKSPAEEAGIKEGEVIIEVDGKAPDSAAVLNGDEGTEITIKIRNKAGETREVKLQRKRFEMATREDNLTWIGEDSAVLKIHSFSRGYSREGIEKLVKEAAGKAKFLVLDLRNNGGGAVSNLRHLMSLLMPEDTVIGTFISRGTAKAYAEEKKVESSDPVELAKFSTSKFKTSSRVPVRFEGKIAVLINRGSGSASEIAAAALRENLKSPLVGAKSAGAVLASVYGRLPHGFECQYPVQDYVTKDYIRLEKNPLVPDHEIERNAMPVDGKDVALDKALEILKQ